MTCCKHNTSTFASKLSCIIVQADWLLRALHFTLSEITKIPYNSLLQNFYQHTVIRTMQNRFFRRFSSLHVHVCVVIYAYFAWSGALLQQRLLEISNSLSDVELRQMKFLAKPRVNAFRLAKIREGFELFEELDTSGELSFTYVRELLEGIRRFDLLEKLEVPLLDNAERGKRNYIVCKVYIYSCQIMFNRPLYDPGCAKGLTGCFKFQNAVSSSPK